MGPPPLSPSFAQGFNRHIGSPGGLLRLYAPMLGPTGLTLYDWGFEKHNGTLTNMAPDAAWASTAQNWAINFGMGVNNVVVCGAVPALPIGWFLTTQMLRTTGGGTLGRTFETGALVDGLRSGGALGSSILVLGSVEVYDANLGIIAGEWNTILIRWDGATVESWVNGALIRSDADVNTWHGGILRIGNSAALTRNMDGQCSLFALGSGRGDPTLTLDPYRLLREAA